MTFWSQHRVLLTGGSGFLGSYLREKLEGAGCVHLFAPARAELDLLDGANVRRYLESRHPDLIIHAAATVGGIGANRANPGRFFYENAMMGIQLIEEARRAHVAKFVCLGTTCSYPKFTPVPFHESDLWNGFPEETNAPYGIAKRALLTQLQAYRTEYGLNGVFFLPANLYGPRDHFDLERSHVIPAMIRKFLEAVERGEESVTLWGDGSPTREFLYAEDAAEAILLGAERYDGPEPVNIGTGREITIRDLAAAIAKATGFGRRIVWDTTKPNGQPRRVLDVSRAAAFGFHATTSLETGLQQTIEWYRLAR